MVPIFILGGVAPVGTSRKAFRIAAWLIRMTRSGTANVMSNMYYTVTGTPTLAGSALGDTFSNRSRYFLLETFLRLITVMPPEYQNYNEDAN